MKCPSMFSVELSPQFIVLASVRAPFRTFPFQYESLKRYNSTNSYIGNSDTRLSEQDTSILWSKNCSSRAIITDTVKPLIKDTPKEDKPPNKGRVESTLVYTLSLNEDDLSTKGKKVNSLQRVEIVRHQSPTALRRLYPDADVV